MTTPRGGRPVNQPENVWKWIAVGAPDECWEWQGWRNSQGYGAMSVNHKDIRAHRLAYMTATGIDPGDLCVLHRCDNPPCCNPAHLFLGTVADNARDAVQKGRRRGERANASKLTETQVIEVRRRRAAGERGIDLAREFGVSNTAVSRIFLRRTWTHV